MPTRNLYYWIQKRNKYEKRRYIQTIRNHKAIDEQLEKCGFFLIAETDFNKTTAEILDIYRKRDVIEKSFDELKNELDMKRLHCCNSETVNGKIFVSFISLIIRSYMLKSLTVYMQTAGCTFRKILTELDKIKCLDLNAKSKPRLLNPVSKTARDIFLALDLPSPD